jgi:phospholipid/cholesterol/gamma-HCH transport system substrate-binding protein
MHTSRLALVGAFVLVGLALFAAGLFMIGERRLLFTRQFEVSTALARVTGLAVGTQVRVGGMPAGEVLEIVVPRVPSEPFVVRMRLRDDLRHLVRTDSICTVQTDGIVGSAFIQVGLGSDEAPVVQDGYTLEGREMIELADLVQEGRETFRTLTSEVLALEDDVRGAIAAVTDAGRSIEQVVSATGTELEAMVKTGHVAVEDTRAILADARVMVERVKAGEGTVGRLLADDALYQHMTSVAGETGQTMANVRAVTARARETFDDLTARNGAAAQMVQSMRQAVADAQEVMSDLAEGTEALKRNFLFRGFFRDRGFFDIDTITRDAYLSDDFGGRDRVPLRVWVGADGLFEPDAFGRERLSEAGRRRLDSAMADFVRYPRDSPLVVEGYAGLADASSPQVLSAERASLVRDYLIDRFRRRATITGALGMGSEAPGSPSGNATWSGVALTLFVHEQALAR